MTRQGSSTGGSDAAFPDEEAQRSLLRFLKKTAGYALLFAAGCWLLWQMRHILPPFFVAFILAITLAPIVDRLESRGVPRGLATGLVYLFVFATLAALLYILIPLTAEQIGQIVADLRLRFKLDQPSQFTATVTQEIQLFGRRNAIPAFIIQPILGQVKTSAVSLTQALESFGRSLIGFIPNLIWVVLVPIIAFYALVDYHRIFAKGLLLFPRQSRDDVRSIASDVTVVFGKYLRGLGLVCLLNTLATILVLLLFPPTRPYAAALGLIAGILYAVPYLGAIVSTALIAIVAFAAPEGGSFAMMLWVTLAMFGLHQLFFDQILAPRILGGHVGLHPILSILALMGGNALFGIAGMLLAVPIAASIQVVVLHVVPRLARNIEVSVQTEPPPIKDHAARDRQMTVPVEAGEGVISEPDTVIRDAPLPARTTGESGAPAG